ncbi:OmpA family protein [Lichenicoccus sp.]|uniref:OmpA family protein n=1 Tax=Lichenicoccus sp. TaxID=2781899 RepID=UPI003D09F4C5
MKHWAALLATTVLVAARAASAQPVTGPYVSLSGGVTFPQDQTLNFAPQLGVRDRWVSFSPGFAGQTSLGWGFGDGLRAELESNYLNAHARGVSFPRTYRVGGYEQQYGGFLNVLYDLPWRLPLHPYVGLGVGAQELDDENINFSPVGVPLPGRPGSQTVSAFAYQAIAGFSAPLPWVRGLAFIADYRLIGLADPLAAIRERHISGPGGDTIAFGNAKFGNVFNHQIQIGLRYAFGSAPRPLPPVAAAQAPAPAPTRTFLVFFDWDHADLTMRARRIVAEAAQASMAQATTRIEVDGYTDRSGTARYNQALSVRRAETVAAELIHDGVGTHAIEMRGFGETHPLVPTADGTREPQNRRVEIILR